MSQSHPTGERRPITSRDWNTSKAVAQWLVARRVSPNMISVLGLIAGGLAGCCFAATSHPGAFERFLWFGGAVFVQLRLLANMLDGMVAVESKRTSPVGELFNEVPDRLSDSATLVGLGLAAHSSLALGLWAALAAMFTAYVRAVGKVAGAHQEFCGPLAKPQRMFLVTLVALFCAFAPREWQRVADVSLLHAALWILIVGAGWTAFRRLIRVARVLQSKRP